MNLLALGIHICALGDSIELVEPQPAVWGKLALQLAAFKD